MKLIITGDSTTPEPSALAIVTPPPQHVDQARHAELRAGVQFERIGEIGIDPAQDHVGALQAGDRADVARSRRAP